MVQTTDDGFDRGRFAGREVKDDGALMVVSGRSLWQGVAPDRGRFAVLDVAFHGIANEFEDFVSFHARGDAYQLALGELLRVAGAALAEVLDAIPSFRPGIAERRDVPGHQEGRNGGDDDGDKKIPMLLHERGKVGGGGRWGNQKTGGELSRQ